tara:strand:- start:16860 stop:17762 length:903 start_codon:yes stop_codon:yes gene_type:complete
MKKNQLKNNISIYIKMSQKRTKNEPQRTKNEPQRTIFRKSKYQCVCCEYITFKKANYTRHMASKKHFKNITLKESSPEKPESSPKKPESSPDTENVEINDLKKQVKQLTNLVGILVEKGVSTTNNTNCNNTIINNHITVDVYLGDHCKNALNIKDFVDQIQVQLEDCVYPSSKLVKDNIVSNLFIDNLKKLPDEERPVHCADARRGKFFVKDNDEWTEMQKEEGFNPLDQQIGRLKYKVYGAAQDAEQEGLIKDDKVQKIREACEISGDPTKINNKILKNIANDCSIHDARKKKSLENID